MLLFNLKAFKYILVLLVQVKNRRPPMQTVILSTGVYRVGDYTFNAFCPFYSSSQYHHQASVVERDRVLFLSAV